MTDDTSVEAGQRLTRYVPRIVAEWDLDAPGRLWQRVDGTLCFVDISGFTPLTEKLARRGRIGAEELTDVLDQTFGSMLHLAYERGGGLLKFGGDALLLLFQGPDHALQAASAGVEMQTALRAASKVKRESGAINLRMSVGIDTGPIDLYSVGESHQELIVTGGTATRVVELESAADAGEILVSSSVAAQLPPGAAKRQKGPGRLLAWRKPRGAPQGPRPRRVVAPESITRRVAVALRGHLKDSSGESEHRIATVGFVKFQGIEKAFEEGGHNEVAQRLNQFVSLVQREADSEGVTFLNADIDKDGGKVTLVTGVPITQTDDEGRMLRACRSILDGDCDLDVRIGVNRGHVFSGYIGTEFRSTYTVMGDIVNAAARVMAAAPVGALYATPGPLDRSMTLFETTELEPLQVKGKTQRLRAYAVGAERGSRPDRPDGALPFTGRGPELETLLGLLEQREDAFGATVGIVGEAGMGKTRLVSEAVEVAGTQDVLWLRGEAIGSDIPYWAFRDPLRRRLGIERRTQDEMASDLDAAVQRANPALAWAVPLLGDVLHIRISPTVESAQIAREYRPARTADVLVQLLAATAGATRLVIVADDHHWMDEASKLLLDQLQSVAVDRDWLVLVTSRNRLAGLSDLIGIVLEPLDDDEARSLAITATDARPLRPHELEAVVERGAGNPLYLTETLRLVRETGSTDDLPESLDAVIGAEIDSLPAPPRRLLRLASVLGRSFREAVLDEFLAPEAMELDAATRRALCEYLEEDDGGRLRFRHAVTHDVAYEGLSFRRRKTLHARAAKVIERLAGNDTDPVVEFLAMHYELAGDYERAWHFGKVAGDKATARYSNIEAISHYRRALAAARRIKGVPSPDLVAVWTALGDVLEQAGMFEEAVETLGRAARRTEDPAAKARIMMKRARAHVRVGSYAAALRQTTIGMRLVQSADGEEAALALSQLTAMASGIRLQEGRPDLALSLAQRAGELARANGDRDALARVYTVLDGALEMLGRPEEAIYADAARAIYEELKDTPGVATVDNNVGVRAYDEGRWDVAIAAYTRAREEFRRAGNITQAALCGANVGEVLVSQGRLDEAEPLIREAVRTLRTANLVDLAIFAEIQSARSELARGNAASAIEVLETLRAEAASLGQRDIALEAAVHLADALIDVGASSEAIDLLGKAEADAGEEAALYEAGLLRVRARAALSMNRRDEARSLASEGVEVARDQGLLYDEALLLEIRAQATAGVQAHNDLEEAKRLLQGLGSVVESDQRRVRLPSISV